jgi:hypothetical protein
MSVAPPTLESGTALSAELQTALEEFLVDAEVVGVTAAVVSDTAVWAGLPVWTVLVSRWYQRPRWPSTGT